MATPNYVFDQLLSLRATLSCLFGFVDSKKRNIDKNTADLNKVKSYLPQVKAYSSYLVSYEYCKQDEEKYWNMYLQEVENLKKANIFTRGKIKKRIAHANENSSFYHQKAYGYQKEIEKYKAIFGDLTGDALTKKLNEIIKGLTDAINSDIDSIKKAFADFEAKEYIISKSDIPYLDYLIYLFDTHRADSIKEALQLLDENKRHNEIMSTLNAISNQITQSINNLSNTIIQAARSINQNLNTINSNLTQISYSVDSLNSKASNVISNQLKTNELLEIGNRISALSYQELRYQSFALSRIAYR